MNAKEQNSFFVFDNFLGDSNWSRRIRRRVVQSSSHRFNAFVTGPRGTGKRLIAQSLHDHGPRREKPFIPIDCAILPANLFQQQVFGQVHRETTTLGGLRSADGGTIYLANVDRLDARMQLDLLDVLDSKSVTPYGSNDNYSLDVRIVVGSPCNLDHEVREGRFRADLFSRLSVLTFETLPLCQRKEDIAPIAQHLVAKLTFERGMAIKQLANPAIELLKAYDWPGNVCEMRDVLDQAISQSTSDTIHARDLGVELNELHATWETLADLEAKHIRDTLAITCGDVGQAAALLGIEVGELEAKLSVM